MKNLAEKIEAKAMSTGAACVLRVMKKSLGRLLSDEQGAALWIECRDHLIKMGCQKIVLEIIGADTDGALDTYDRESLMDAIGHVLVGMEWPANMTPEINSDRFGAEMKNAMMTRCYQVEVE
jgi:hypothetical protein